MKISFPAMRGFIGNREYYSCLMRLSAIPKMFTFRDWAEFSPQDREQRVLNKNRIPDISRYILENQEGYLFSSITASYKNKVEFKPSKEDAQIGLLEMELEDANFVINDGQHRCRAIEVALKENPQLGEESISVLLFNYENLGRVQQMFSDLNRFVAKTSRSLDILYDKRDPLSRIILDATDRVPTFQGLVDKDSTTLPARSNKLFTLTALYDATKEFLGDLDFDADDFFHGEVLTRVVEFWSLVSDQIPEWARIKQGTLSAIEYRQEKIGAHSVVLRAIGSVGYELADREDKLEVLSGLAGINWRKSNPDWENVCIVANSVVSNRQARVATRAYLKFKLGLDLSDVERRSISHLLEVA